MIYRCIQNFARGYITYKEGTLWERFPSLKKEIFLININTGEWIKCSKTEFDLHFIEV